MSRVSAPVRLWHAAVSACDTFETSIARFMATPLTFGDMVRGDFAAKCAEASSLAAINALLKEARTLQAKHGSGVQLTNGGAEEHDLDALVARLESIATDAEMIHRAWKTSRAAA